MENIEKKIKEIISVRYGMDAKIESNFVDDLGMDSLDTIELVMDLETEFGIDIPDDDSEKMITVKDVVDYIEKKK